MSKVHVCKRVFKLMAKRAGFLRRVLEPVCVGSGRVERHSSQSLCSVDQVAGLLDYALLRRD